MAKAANLFDPNMLKVHNLGYAPDATVLFQRLSVCVTSLVLVGAMLKATHSSRGSAKGLTAFVLVVCNAGLIMVDNIHFQYNSKLLGEAMQQHQLVHEYVCQHMFGCLWAAVVRCSGCQQHSQHLAVKAAHLCASTQGKIHLIYTLLLAAAAFVSQVFWCTPYCFLRRSAMCWGVYFLLCCST